MPPRDLRAHLFDVAEACRLIEEFTRGASFDDYQRTVLLRSAVERQFEIIGEALSQALRYHPSLAGQTNESDRIIAFRNQLAHGYSSVADDVVWVRRRNEPACPSRACERPPARA
ncbi:MAG TPA: HepT-like ribonuclease domain-containing protein [Candidatus Saccharimonadales bacterium]|nr:HepT-like ribonuclease domain-containing protein [Candidatus Saccharimonadales bacterium]